MDEVHTYEGITGAQNALTLRRWRHAIGEVPKIQLGWAFCHTENATEFFGSITNLDLSRVYNEKPSLDDDEYDEEGS